MKIIKNYKNYVNEHFHDDEESQESGFPGKYMPDYVQQHDDDDDDDDVQYSDQNSDHEIKDMISKSISNLDFDEEDEAVEEIHDIISKWEDYEELANYKGGEELDEVREEIKNVLLSLANFDYYTANFDFNTDVVEMKDEVETAVDNLFINWGRF